MGDTARKMKNDMEEAGDKIKAGMKAAGKKMEDPSRDTETEYNKEKAKERVTE